MSGLAGPLLAIAALMAGLVAFVRLPPRRALAALVLSVAAALAALRQVAIAAPLAMVGAHLWRSAGPAARPSPGRRSEARTGWLAMTLDHDSGQMDGEVLAGTLAGRRLSTLSAEEMQTLSQAIEAARDEESRALLQAWLDRHGGREETPAAPPGNGAMSEAEALRILGLAPGATLDEIRAAHRRLMKRVHPDLGGSGALAAMINAAKERLEQ